MPLRTQRQHRDKSTKLISNADPSSTVAHLHLDTLSLAPKEGFQVGEDWNTKRARIEALIEPPPTLDEVSEALREMIEEAQLSSVQEADEALEVDEREEQEAPKASIQERDGWITFANVCSPEPDMTLEEETRACFSTLSGACLSPRRPECFQLI